MKWNITAMLMGVAVTLSCAAAEPDDWSAPRRKPETKPAPVEPVKKDEPTRATPPPPAPIGSWSIVLASYRGEDQKPLAEAALKNVRDAGITDAYTEPRGRATVVAVGRYSTESSPDARRRLEELRATKRDGKYPYYGALLSPSSGENLGTRPEWNLLASRQQHEGRGRYTLQVAAYGRTDGTPPTDADLADARKAAEQAVALLRQEGEEAYYFHSLRGKRLSMVCLGVFDDEDLPRKGDPDAGIAPRDESDALTTLKQRHPYNLVNGQPLKVIAREKHPVNDTIVKVERLQPSALVEIPQP